MQGWPSSSARYWLMRMQALPCSIQKRRVSSLGEDRVRGSHFYRVYMMASANKFLRIYYAKVKAYLESLEQL